MRRVPIIAGGITAPASLDQNFIRPMLVVMVVGMAVAPVSVPVLIMCICICVRMCKSARMSLAVIQRADS